MAKAELEFEEEMGENLHAHSTNRYLVVRVGGGLSRVSNFFLSHAQLYLILENCLAVRGCSS